MKYKIIARASVNPTEDLDKIIKALSNILDYDDILISDESVTVTGNVSCLLPLKEILEKRQIRDTARRMILKGWNEKSNTIYLKLSKQAAFAGLVNLVDDDLSPLGEIEVEIHTEDMEEFADWLCAH